MAAKTVRFNVFDDDQDPPSRNFACVLGMAIASLRAMQRSIGLLGEVNNEPADQRQTSRACGGRRRRGRTPWLEATGTPDRLPSAAVVFRNRPTQPIGKYSDVRAAYVGVQVALRARHG